VEQNRVDPPVETTGADPAQTDETPAPGPDPAAVGSVPADPAAMDRMMECLRLGGVTARVTTTALPGTDTPAIEVLTDSVYIEPNADGGYNIDNSIFRQVGDSAFVLVNGAEVDDQSNAQQWITPVNSRAFQGSMDEIYRVYAKCEAEHPDFAQPNAQQFEQQAREEVIRRAEAGLPFAQCARDAGFSWVADPIPAEPSLGYLVIPPTVTEEEFRSLVTQCGNRLDNPGFYSDESSFNWGQIWEEIMWH
jgi:hypothetical protein